MRYSGSNRKSGWRLIVPVVVLALVIGTTLGEMWHRHVNTSSETCPICHLSHQAAEPAEANVCAEILVLTGPGPEPREATLVSHLVVSQVPARAPPA